MKFQPGDLVEIIGVKTTATGLAHIRNGMRGEIVGDWEIRDGFVVWRLCIDGNDDIAIREYCLRKIPPDDGRALVRWDQCDWRPSRSLVEA